MQSGGDVEFHQRVDLVFGELVEVHGEIVALPDVVDEHADIQALDGLADLGLGGLVEVAEVDACFVLVRGVGCDGRNDECEVTLTD